MDSHDQKLVDLLYENVYSQKIRCEYFNSLGSSSNNSVWNKHADEKKILDIMFKKYKKYYTDKAHSIKNSLLEVLERNVSSYLTYNVDYYINQNNDRMEEVNKYVVRLESMTINDISNVDLSFISDELHALFPNFMPSPVLFGKLYK